MSLSSKVAVVTGGANGLGAATVRQLALNGARVVVFDIEDVSSGNEPPLESVAARFHKVDVSDLDQWKAALNDVVREFGTIDILLLNAGIATRPAGAEIDDDPLDWFDQRNLNRLIDVNVRGVAYGIMAALPHLRRSQGSVIVIGSIASVRAFEQDPLYCMSKHAVLGLSVALAPRLAADGIRLNMVCPGGMYTRLIGPSMRQIKLSTTRHVSEVICRVIERGQIGEVWLVPSDGSARLFQIDPLALTADQAQSDTTTLNQPQIPSEPQKQMDE